MKTCKNCGADVTSKNSRNKFCSRSCAAKYNNARRPEMSDEQKERISISMKSYFAENPNAVSKGTKHSKAVGKGTKGKYQRRIKTFYGITSSRTRAKILKRLNISCCICGWQECSVDTHHIIPRCDGGSDDLYNLTPLCPNHHRMAGHNMIPIEQFVRFSDIITLDQLNEVYYG